MEAFPIIKYIKLVDKKEFAPAALNAKHAIFIFYIASLTSFALLIPSNSNIYLFCKSQIVSLIAKKALIIVFAEYTNFANILSLNLAFKINLANSFIRLFQSLSNIPIFFD